MNQPIQLYGVGAGPGDPELITVKALHVLNQADIILCPDSGSSSALRRIVDAHGLSEKVRYLSVPMKKKLSVAQHQADCDIRYQQVENYLKQGLTVAYLCLGDPSLYSSFSPVLSQAQLEGYACAVIPGVIAASALAAQAQQPLAQGLERLHIVPCSSSFQNEKSADDTTGVIDECAAVEPVQGRDAYVYMKAHKSLRQLKELPLSDTQYSQAVVGINLGLEGERLVKLSEVEGAVTSYFTTVLIPADKRAVLKSAGSNPDTCPETAEPTDLLGRSGDSL